MPREGIEFKSSDNVTLRGWLYKPTGDHSKLPCLVMSHGFSAVKEMDLDAFAEYFSSKLPLSCLVFDNRGFGDSDVAPGQVRQEIIPAVQCSDISDAVTYAQSRSDIDADRIGVWGSSFSGGNVLYVGATDRRVKAVLSQVPFIDGVETMKKLVPAEVVPHLNAAFQEGQIILPKL
jgi:cephalosporin-C deacetylase-like acetyl esterase